MLYCSLINNIVSDALGFENLILFTTLGGGGEEEEEEDSLGEDYLIDTLQA